MWVRIVNEKRERKISPRTDLSSWSNRCCDRTVAIECQAADPSQPASPWKFSAGRKSIKVIQKFRVQVKMRVGRKKNAKTLVGNLVSHTRDAPNHLKIISCNSRTRAWIGLDVKRATAMWISASQTTSLSLTMLPARWVSFLFRRNSKSDKCFARRRRGFRWHCHRSQTPPLRLTIEQNGFFPVKRRNLFIYFECSLRDVSIVMCL